MSSSFPSSPSGESSRRLTTRGVSRSRLDPADQVPQSNPSLDAQEYIEVCVSSSTMRGESQSVSLAPSVSVAPSNDGSNINRNVSTSSNINKSKSTSSNNIDRSASSSSNINKSKSSQSNINQSKSSSSNINKSKSSQSNINQSKSSQSNIDKNSSSNNNMSENNSDDSSSKDSHVEAVTGLLVRSNDADAIDKGGDEEFMPDGGVDSVESQSVGSQLGRIQNGESSSAQKAGIFSDEKGNLRFVNLVVRNPCLMFFGILIISLVLSFLLVASVIRSGENPFADPALEYDVNDIRSIAYDSFKLARQEVLERREENANNANIASATSSNGERHRKHNDTIVRRSRSLWSRFLQETSDDEMRTQEETLDNIFWAFESQTADEDLFGSAESISAMKEGLDLFLKDPDYEKYCRRIYIDIPTGGFGTDGGTGTGTGTGSNTDSNTTGVVVAGNSTSDGNGDLFSGGFSGTMTQSTSFCMPPLTALNMYYASEWDPLMVEYVVGALQTQENFERYNALALCIEYGLYCEQIPSRYNTTEDKEWAIELNSNITQITSKWDLQGDLQEEHLSQITEFAATMLELDTKRGLVEFGFDADFSRANPKSKYSRLIVTWGGPLNDITTTPKLSTPDEDPDRAKLKAYIVGEFLDELEALSQPTYSDQLNSYYFMGVLILEVLLQIVQRDAMLAIASFGFVFLYIRISVGSWFLAFVGMLEITLSIPISWFIFGICFRIEYFSFLNALCLFIVAAIGADDIFIFMDAYKQSAHNSEEPEILQSLESRMSWVYRRTGSAMLITSATTCSAFLCTLITPLAGVRAFGVFAATVILVDYILVMTMFCTAVVIYHNKFEGKSCIAACCCGVGNGSEGGCCANTEPSPTANAFDAMTEGNDKHAEDFISKFFRTKVASFILNQWTRLAMGMVFLAWIVIATLFAFKIQPTQESEQFLNENHPLQKSFSIFGTAFNKAASDDGQVIHFTWGLEEVDREGVNQLLDPSYFGTPTFVEEFEFTEQCQTELLSVCDDFKTNTAYTPYIKQVNGVGVVKCFVEEFGAFSALGSLEDCDAVKNGAWKNTDWQVAPEDVPAMMQDFLEASSCYSDTRGSVSSHYNYGLGWNGVDLEYAGISLESNVLDPFGRQSERVVREQYDAMIDISKTLDSTMTDYCAKDSNVIMTDLNEKFIFMNNQAIYVRSAWQSALLGICIAFTVLLISTRVLHIALFATLSIICVLVSVSGTMVMIGWQLGSIEAILIAIVAGFSVDYVVHLAHAYERAAGDAPDRIRAAFGEMGISVLNGMVTSVGASLPLFFCQLQFFRKFGTFLCLTIAFSWVFANFGFMSILATFRIPIKRKGWNW